MEVLRLELVSGSDRMESRCLEGFASTKEQASLAQKSVHMCCFSEGVVQHYGRRNPQKLTHYVCLMSHVG